MGRITGTGEEKRRGERWGEWGGLQEQMRKRGEEKGGRGGREREIERREGDRVGPVFILGLSPHNIVKIWHSKMSQVLIKLSHLDFPPSSVLGPSNIMQTN